MSQRSNEVGTQKRPRFCCFQCKVFIVKLVRCSKKSRPASFIDVQGLLYHKRSTKNPAGHYVITVMAFIPKPKLGNVDVTSRLLVA